MRSQMATRKGKPRTRKQKSDSARKPRRAVVRPVRGRQLPPYFPVHSAKLNAGIRPSAAFDEKGLAQFGINVGLKCGHDCTYCSSGAMLRTHPAFRLTGENPFGRGYAIVDPYSVGRVARDAKSISSRKRGIVQICTTVDAWSPEAKAHDLGRGCLKAVLAEPGWTVRILTKNAAVVKDFDVCREYRDRVLVGVSLTATASKQAVMKAVEPNASLISDRMNALRLAHKEGLRTYAMLCPLLPGISDDASEILKLVRFAKSHGAEEIFAEAVNPRGKGLIHTQEALENLGFTAEARAVESIRQRKNRSPYVAALVANVQRAVRQVYGNTKKLRFLLYGGDLLKEDRETIMKDSAGVIWLN